jgi:hypothetical protein
VERHSAFQTVTDARSRAFRKVIDHDDSRVPPSDEQTRAAMTGSSPRGRALSNVQLWGLTHPASITGHSGRIELLGNGR